MNGFFNQSLGMIILASGVLFANSASGQQPETDHRAQINAANQQLVDGLVDEA